MKLILAVLSLAVLASSCAYRGFGKQDQVKILFDKVPEHVHRSAVNNPCNMTCAGSVCTTAFDMESGELVDCWSKEADICICQVPPRL
jgi:hypothetical protein